MKFSEGLLKNPFFYDQLLAFDVLQPQHLEGGKTLRTGALIQPNGDTLFRIYAPGADAVVVNVGQQRRACTLVKQDNGVFESVLPYDEELAGIHMIELYVDGAQVLSPYIPISFAGNRLANFIEVPEADSDYLLVKDVPHGRVGTEVYWSEPRGTWERCMVYTPPGYTRDTVQRYPVLYVTNGGSENEVAFFYILKIQYIMDNLIAAGKARPFIIVGNNAMLRYSQEAEMNHETLDDCFERTVCESCIPFMDSAYRTLPDKWNRAIAGLSMGGFITNVIGLNHPELFGSIGQFTCCMTHEHNFPRPYREKLKDKEAFAKNYKLFFRSTTKADLRYGDFISDDELCEESGIDQLPGYHRLLYPRIKNFKVSWRWGFRDFAQLLFKEDTP